MLLEPILAGHAAYLFPILKDERIYRYIPREPPASIPALEDRYRRLESRRSPDGEEAWLNWAARLKSGTSYIGRVEATVRRDGVAYLAYELSPDFWGSGYAGEGCQAVIAHLFARYSVKEALAEVDTRNSASISLLERLGFERVEYQAEADFFKGSPSDEYTYRLPHSVSGCMICRTDKGTLYRARD